MATPTSTLAPSLTSSTPTATCTTAVPDHHGYVPVDACNAQWPYSPSFAAAIAFAVLFGLLTLAHLVLAITFRKGFCWVIIMASAWETTAFVVRAIGSHDQQNQAMAIASQLFFLLAPLWVNAFAYMTAGRLIWTFHPDKKIWGFKAISLGKWFVWLDIFSFIVQGAGGTMLNPGNSAKAMDVGKKLYMVGVGVQELFILLFTALIVKFHRDALGFERQGLLHSGKGSKLWKWLTYALYSALLLITMRIIFRLVEFSGGMDPATNQIPFKEGYALGLDAFPMVLAILVLAVLHPGLVLRGEESEFPSRKVRKAEKKAKKLEKKEEKRARKGGRGEVEMGYLGTSEVGEQPMGKK
ncbi:RTA1 like protein-domain-containing protein [Phaeosphaeriaceae sp. PMI808]|nr:RTA1 like protein-domain-containing protein [Phaeosphaeriaceae sp. PMI808]